MKRWMMVGLIMAAFGLSACGAKQTPDVTALGGVFVVDGEVATPFYDTGVLLAEELVHSQESGLFMDEPNLVIEVTEPTEFEIVARAPIGDLVLSVSGPGLPLFDDDTYSLDPAISKTFAPGRYEVRVGVWSGATRDLAYELVVRAPLPSFEHAHGGEFDHHHGHDHGHHGHAQLESAELNLSGEPALGVLRAEDFAGPPKSATLAAEGATTEYWPGIYHTSRPLVVVDPSDLGDDIGTLIVRASSSGRALDSVIIIVDEEGERHWVDDVSGLDAGATFYAERGVLHIFAGVYSEAAAGEEVDYEVVLTRAANTREPFETERARLGDAPIYHSVNGAAFGTMTDWGVEGCWGVVRDARTPDLRVQVSNASTSVVFRALSVNDAFLAVRTPSGQVLCNDDADGLNARVTVTDTEEGEYEVWGGAVGTHVQPSEMRPATQIRTVLSVERGLPLGQRPVFQIGMEGFEIQTHTHTNRRSEPVMGNAAICDGALSAYLDLSRPTAVLENTTSEPVVALVRSHASHLTALFTMKPNGSVSCAVGDIGDDAYDGEYLQPGERLVVWAGSVNEADAQKPFELRTLFFDDAHADVADVLLAP